MITVERNETRISREEIGHFEEELGTRLPWEYVKFLEEYNGGYPERNCLRVDDTVIAVQLFHGLQVEPMDDLRANAEILAGRIPPRSLAIAALEGGDALVMALDEQHYGRIYWWEHEIEENQISELTLLAQSFSELMEKLEPDTEEVDLDPDDVLGAWDGPDDPESREGEQ